MKQNTQVHLVYDGGIGRWQYVIGTGNGTKTYVLKQVNYIADLQRITDKTQLVQVRYAYLDDPTVNAGWAIYYFDSQENEWFKVVEQESLDVEVPKVELPELEGVYAKVKYVDDQDNIIKQDVAANHDRITKIELYLNDCDNELNKLDVLIG